jgi:hypothetical protein
VEMKLTFSRILRKGLTEDEEDFVYFVRLCVDSLPLTSISALGLETEGSWRSRSTSPMSQLNCITQIQGHSYVREDLGEINITMSFYRSIQCIRKSIHFVTLQPYSFPLINLHTIAHNDKAKTGF